MRDSFLPNALVTHVSLTRYALDISILTNIHINTMPDGTPGYDANKPKRGNITLRFNLKPMPFESYSKINTLLNQKMFNYKTPRIYTNISKEKLFVTIKKDVFNILKAVLND